MFFPHRKSVLLLGSNFILRAARPSAQPPDRAGIDPFSACRDCSSEESRTCRKIGMQLYSLTTRYVVVVTTPQLWRPSHSEAHLRLADLVMRLRDGSGVDFAHIADVLNAAGLKSPRGKLFYPALVYSMYQKWTNRLLREKRQVLTRLGALSVSALVD